MVVDDDASLRRMMALTLREGGFDVVSAGDGNAALDHVYDDAPDAIVLDLEMPVMDGRTFYRRLRASGIQVPVVIVSAHNARAAQRELGANASLSKPFDPDELVSEVRSLL
jgi:DNA-binding response OmpR family regulator